MVKIRPVIAKILLLLLLFLIVAVVFVVVVFDVAVIVVLDPETFLYSLVKIGSVTAEILLTLNLRWWWVGVVVCRVIFMSNLTLGLVELGF